MILMISILLTLAGYSTGAALANRRKKRIADPGLFDCALITLTCTAEIICFRSIAKPAPWILSAFPASAIVGFLLHSLFYARSGFTTTGSGEFVFVAGERNIGAGLPAWQRTWNGWKSFASESGDFQGRLLVSLVYFMLLWPFSFFAPAAKHPHTSTSNWHPRVISNNATKESQRQF